MDNANEQERSYHMTAFNKYKGFAYNWWGKIQLWYWINIKQYLCYKWPFKQIGKALYWLRTHTYNRYHMIDIRNPYNGYKWGWIDRSEAILFANFAILCDFIEKEHPFEIIDFEHDDYWRNLKKELVDLYHWWKIGRKAEQDQCDSLYTEIEQDNRILNKRVQELRHQWLFEEEERIEAVDDINLIRLIKIRGCMWT